MTTLHNLSDFGASHWAYRVWMNDRSNWVTTIVPPDAKWVWAYLDPARAGGPEVVIWLEHETFPLVAEGAVPTRMDWFIAHEEEIDGRSTER